MTDFVDGGQRCSDHVGEAFPPRCGDCEALNAEVRAEPSAPEAWAPIGSFPDPWSEKLPNPWR